jgi:hypothetical protein
MARILGDEGDPRCRLRASIAMLMTVGSVVFRPEDGVLWVAAGEAPTSQRAYVPLSLATEGHAPEHGTLPQGGSSAQARAAFEAYRDAYLAYFDHDDLQGARALMARSCALQPEQPLYHVLSGLLAIAAREPGAALPSLDRALALGHPDPERVAAFHLWRGRAADLLGRRGDALADYRSSLRGPADGAVRRAAHRGQHRPYTKRQAGRLRIDFAYADVVSA